MIDGDEKAGVFPLPAFPSFTKRNAWKGAMMTTKKSKDDKLEAAFFAGRNYNKTISGDLYDLNRTDFKTSEETNAPDAGTILSAYTTINKKRGFLHFNTLEKLLQYVENKSNVSRSTLMRMKQWRYKYIFRCIETNGYLISTKTIETLKKDKTPIGKQS